MSSNPTIQQHQPLRVPHEWSESERRFAAQLEEVLDDIYRRFGRLALKDLSKELRRILTEAEKFSVEVRTEKVSLSNMTLDKNGFSLRGGIIELLADTLFRVASGGSVQIDAKDGFIRLGEGHFNATENGDVSARTGDFAEGLAVSSKPVWHQGNAIVSTSQPEGHGILWIRPSETQTVRYAYPTGTERNVNWHNATHSFDLTADTGDTMIGSNFTYTLTIPMYEIEGTVRGVRVAATLSKGDSSIVFPVYTMEKITQWELQTIRLTAESAVNLAEDADPIGLTVTVTDANQGLYLQRDMEIALQIRSDSAGGEAQNCSLHWIP